MQISLKKAVLIVVAVMLAGAALRLDQVSTRSMTHVEMFVPGIPLPPGLSVPKPRMDLWTVVTSTLNSDTHPPGYYIFMWFVTKWFGSSTLAMRLPSVFFGVASIALVFWLGMLIGQRTAALIAAVLLAFNGYHILWSKTARMYPMLCFLGLLATILLLVLAKSRQPRRGLEIGYAAVVIAGLCTQDFFWILLATQMLWVMVNAWNEHRPMPRVLNVQIVAAILGSPLLAFAAYQSGNQVAVLSADVPASAREYLTFVYLIPGVDDSYAADGSAGLALPPQLIFLRVILALFCALLLIIGIRRLKRPAEQLARESSKLFRIPCLLAAAVATVTILAHIVIAQHHGEVRPQMKYTKMMAALPLLMALGAILLEKMWGRLRVLFARLPLQFLSGSPALVWCLAVGPFLLLSAASVLFRPLLYPRGFLFLLPFLVLTIAVGLLELARRNRWLAISLFAMVGVLHAFSVAAYRDRIESPVNFRAFADKLKPDIRSDDLIFLRRDWDTTPILYYLTSDRYHVRAIDSAEAIPRDPHVRVWVLLFRGEDLPRGMEPKLADYHEVGTVDVHLAQAVLYCRSGCSAGRVKSPAA